MKYKIVKKNVFFMMFFVQSLICLSQTYTASVGETLYLSVPSVSPGYVSKTIWACSNPAIQFISKDEVGATIKVVNSFSGTATVELVYVQTYTGSYSGSTEAVTHYKNYYIQCETGNSTIEPTSISLSSGQTVIVGQSIQLTPVFVPANASSKLYWSIRQITGGATISGRGILYGTKSGDVAVSVSTENGLTASCYVRVIDLDEAVSVTLPKTQVIGIGDPITLTCIVEPSNSNTTLTWKSSDTSIATVRSGGIVTGKKMGETDITVKTTNGLTSVCHVIVRNIASRAAIETAYSKALNAFENIYILKNKNQAK